MFQIYFNSYLHCCFFLHPQVENQALRTTERDALLQASVQIGNTLGGNCYPRIQALEGNFLSMLYYYGKF